MLNPNLAYTLRANSIPSGRFVQAFVKIRKGFHETPCYWAKLECQILPGYMPRKSFIQPTK